MNLFNELKRRNVFRVALFYIVAAWVVIQVAETVLPMFDVPDGMLRGLVILLALGFIPAVIFAWVFEWTPEGIQREADLSVNDGTQRRTANKLNWATLIVAVLAIGLLIADRMMRASGPTDGSGSSTGSTGATANPGGGAASEGAPARSIAVLAFDDLSPDADQAYFAEGVSEELLNLLARVDDFKVAARTSSFKFKGSDADIAEIGRALNVETVLEGSVRKAGDQVRVTAQLIKVEDGFHLWSASYDRRLENIFAVQDEIAGAIVEALKLELNIAAETASRTTDVEAYDHYLRGRQLAREPSRSGLLRAIDLYERAIAIDPEFAAAYAGIADAWVWLEDYGGMKSVEVFPKAEQAARRALELDAESAEAHAAMAFVLDRYHNDQSGARDAFERTLQLNPNYVTAYNLYGDTLADLGDLTRMIEVHRKAVELDPLSVFMKTRLASKLISVGQFDEAKRIIGGVFAEFPDNDFAHEEIGNLHYSRRELAEAVRHYRVLHFARPGDPFAASQIAVIAGAVGDRPLADAWIAAARTRGEDNRWELSARAMLAIGQGDWAALERNGELAGGDAGAFRRGLAASARQAWPEARRHLLESLRIGGYRAGGTVLASHSAALVELGWVEQQLGLSESPQRLALARPMLEQMLAGGTNFATNEINNAYLLARLEAIEGRREGSLGALRTAWRGSFIDHRFLDRDPVFAAWRDDPEFRALVEDMRRHLTAEREKLAGQERMP
jgi:TolB-like protein/Tfp pilus assembly protein PilF